MDSNKIYCVYLTVYKGNLLPPFYIGSTSIDRISKGYRGSVKSKAYKSIWDDELKNNPSLFSTSIVSTHYTRKEAIAKELFFHESLNVVDNPLYINRSKACKDGCFGSSMKKHAHPNYGKRGDEVNWYGMKRSEVAKKNYSDSKRGDKNPQTCVYAVYDNEDNEIFNVKGNFIKTCEEFNIPNDVIKKLVLSYKNNSEPLSYKKKGVTGPKPKFDKSYIGWYAVKTTNKPWQTENEKRTLGKHWYYNPATKEYKLCHNPPQGFIKGRKGYNPKKGT